MSDLGGHKSPLQRSCAHDFACCQKRRGIVRERSTREAPPTSPAERKLPGLSTQGVDVHVPPEHDEPAKRRVVATLCCQGSSFRLIKNEQTAAVNGRGPHFESAKLSRWQLSDRTQHKFSFVMEIFASKLQYHRRLASGVVGALSRYTAGAA